MIKRNGAFEYYQGFTDQQGSILEVYDADGSLVFKARYDAWGRQSVSVNEIGLYHGYTGHEMLAEFGLIDMRGRVYDPALGRFLSPDNYVQAPTSSQSFNRYSYCINNPLKYTDPSGEFWHLVIGAAIGGIINWGTNDFQFSWKGLGYFATGAIAGAVGAGVGSGVNVAMAGGNFWAGAFGLAKGISSTGFIAGTVKGISSGFASGFILGTGNSWLGNNRFATGLLHGLGSGIMNALSNGILEGVSGGFDALDKGTNFWTGKTTLNLNGAYSCSGCMPSDFNVGERTITGKYVGQFEGVNVFESKNFGSIITPEADGYLHYRAATIPERGIIAAEGLFTSGIRDGVAMMQHEFGHILQYRMFGASAYWQIVAPESFFSATFAQEKHYMFWTEKWANYLSKNFFREKWIGGKNYPVQDITPLNLLRMRIAKYLK